MRAQGRGESHLQPDGQLRDHTIKGISINFNHQSGRLSSMSLEQLFRNSVQSGLANMCWDEFCGSMMSCSGSRPAKKTADCRHKVALQWRRV
ncbi:MAG: major capsid protein V20 domain-containing protein, partial [Candidatus Fonsibacter sp.]